MTFFEYAIFQNTNAPSTFPYIVEVTLANYMSAGPVLQLSFNVTMKRCLVTGYDIS